MIEIIALVLGVSYMMWLAYERYSLRKARAQLKHVIHINGTRGKSTVTRLIGAALAHAGYKVHVKVTGTLPMIIDIEGNEKIIHRLGRANIKEQIKILKQAVKSGAEILVIECMAVMPEYQRVTQHEMLNADILVLTNVRMDHVEEMGNTLEAIAEALANTIPTQGTIVLREVDDMLFDSHITFANANKVIASAPLEIEKGIDFYHDNVALALTVANHLGVATDIAISGMREYQRDCGSLSIFKLTDTYFVSGFSINDPDSILSTYEQLKQHPLVKDLPLTVLLNNRYDRPYRARQHIHLVKALNPKRLYVAGGFKYVVKRKLRKSLPNTELFFFHDVKQIEQEPFVFAIGNIANQGMEILEYVRKNGVMIDG